MSRAPLPLSAFALLLATNLSAQEQPSPTPRTGDTLTFNAVSVIGKNGTGSRIPGSAQSLDRPALERQDYSDVHRVLREVPGVEVREEDGFGLRPNIGIRGTAIDRSGKVALMEDGILIAPAPYSASAAYYFPSVGRMSGVEIRKGSSQVPYGPSTTGGVINFLSTPIPAENSGKLQMMVGEYGTGKLHAYYGGSTEHVGWLFETFQHQSDGFKTLDSREARRKDHFQKKNTGFDRADWLAKLRFNTSQTAAVYQEIEFKAGRTDDVSDETYLGLSQADYDANPYRRYAASAEDHMNVDQTQLSARYFARPLNWLDVNARVYRNTVHRNWYKLNDVRNSANTGWVSTGNVLADPTTYASEYRVLTGDSNSVNGLRVRANNRQYLAQGVQLGTELRPVTGPLSHTVNLGLRYHYDEEDRFQHDDRYGMVDGVMSFASGGAPGSQTNRFVSAKALSLFIEDAIAWNDFTLTPGVRYERLDFSSKNWGTSPVDSNRTGGNLTTTKSDVDVLVWGVGLNYAATNALEVFTGVHKGFEAPGPTASDSTRPEQSVNVELGARYQEGALSVQSTAFINFYDNLLGRETASGGGASSQELFNAGSARIYGLEFAAGYDVAALFDGALRLPVRAVYTFTHGEFTSDSVQTSYWGLVSKGDEMPELARHTWLIGAGAEYGPVSFDAAATYTGAMRNVAGSGAIPADQKLGEYLLVDLTVNYRVNDNLRLVGAAKNLFDETGLASRKPAGLRPTMPRLLSAGIIADF
jgi:Fe(3+) dicitrate transport protein